MHKIKIGIYGGTGYTGWELTQLLLKHPQVEIAFITSERLAGQSLRSTWPLAPEFTLQSTAEVDLADVDCVFLCLPHTETAQMAAAVKAVGVAVVDLSADLRLNTAESYQSWYKVAHPAPELLPVVYGLPEFYRDEIAGAKMVANPGCYATSMLLSLLPLAQAGLLAAHGPVIVDAKSGTTGGGRSPKQNLLFSEVHGNFSPDNIGRGHRHIGEVEQQLEAAGLPDGRLIFSPHLLPTDRGILSAVYAPVTDMDAAAAAIRAAYADEPLVIVLPDGGLATLGHVVRTPLAILSLTPGPENT
ncbi:MAG: N-acetyl-gamma-glutamyl-phosphate reductase, partial [Anaerolineales bacterium]